MTTVTRDDLIDTVKRALYDDWRRREGMHPVGDVEWSKVRHMAGHHAPAVAALDAVLPPIADLIAARAEVWGYDYPAEPALNNTARLVRGLTKGADRAE